MFEPATAERAEIYNPNNYYKFFILLLFSLEKEFVGSIVQSTI